MFMVAWHIGIVIALVAVAFFGGMCTYSHGQKTVCRACQEERKRTEFLDEPEF